MSENLGAMDSNSPWALNMSLTFMPGIFCAGIRVLLTGGNEKEVECLTQLIFYRLNIFIYCGLNVTCQKIWVRWKKVAILCIGGIDSE